MFYYRIAKREKKTRIQLYIFFFAEICSDSCCYYHCINLLSLENSIPPSWLFVSTRGLIHAILNIDSVPNNKQVSSMSVNWKFYRIKGHRCIKWYINWFLTCDNIINKYNMYNWDITFGEFDQNRSSSSHFRVVSNPETALILFMNVALNAVKSKILRKLIAFFFLSPVVAYKWNQLNRKEKPFCFQLMS